MRRERILLVIVPAVGTGVSISSTILRIRPDKFVMSVDQSRQIGHAQRNVFLLGVRFEVQRTSLPFLLPIAKSV
jgi:hypothetical protein